MPAVTAIVLHHNGTDYLDACFKTLLAQDHPGLTVCVVDNASTDGSPEWLQAHYPTARLLEAGGNLGWSGGNNVGIRHALQHGADWIWLLNDDIELEPNCLRNMLEFAEKHPNVRLLSPVIHLTSDRNRVWYQGGKIDFARNVVSHCASLSEFRSIARPARRFISGCCLLVHRSVFEQAGLPDERFFMYYEDGDFSLRAEDAGFDMDVVADTRIYHHLMAATGGYHFKNPFRTYHMCRSELLFWRKHLGFWAFHRRYCLAHLSKWFLDTDTAAPGAKAIHEAKCDALWFFLTNRRCYRRHPHSPAWFRRLMLRRAWVIIALMGFDLVSLLGRRRRLVPRT